MCWQDGKNDNELWHCDCLHRDIKISTAPITLNHCLEYKYPQPLLLYAYAATEMTLPSHTPRALRLEDQQSVAWLKKKKLNMSENVSFWYIPQPVVAHYFWWFQLNIKQ